MVARAIITRWPIRWKLLALMWLLAMSPVLIVAWVDIRTLAELGTRLATETGQVLSDQARLTLEQQADDYVRLIAEKRRLLELMVRLQAYEAERVLYSSAEPTRGEVFWEADFAREAPALALQRDLNGYFQETADNPHKLLAVSYSALAFRAAPGATGPRLHRQAARLSYMANQFRRMPDEHSPVILSQYLALESGLHAIYPGHAGYPASFDPRVREWYQAQKATRTPRWSNPHRDPISGLSVISASAPLFDPKQQFIGVTGIDVHLTHLLPTTGAFSARTGGSEMLLATISAAASQQNEISILAYQDDANGARDWHEAPTVKNFATDESSATSTLLADMRAGRNGFTRFLYQGRSTFCAYRRFDTAGTYLLFLIRRELATRPAAAAAEYALATTNRQVEALIPLALLAAVAAAALAFVAARMITGPIQQLSAAVEEVAQGKFDVRVDIHSGDELETLGVAFNRMVPQIKAHAYMKNALVVAREVQQQLLPTSAPVTSALDFHGVCLYADETGGDYYDYLDLRTRDLPALGVVIGDVSGHGIASALLMATARALLHGSDLDPGELGPTLEKLNQNLAGDVKAGRFMTLFLLLFDLETQKIAWASAGHDPVLGYRRHDDSHFELAGNDIPLGVDRQWRYGATRTRDYLEGDVFLLATDGVWEAQSPNGERFGKERLAASLRRFAQLSAREIGTGIAQVVADFRAQVPARDDLTLVVVKVGKSPPIGGSRSEKV